MPEIAVFALARESKYNNINPDETYDAILNVKLDQSKLPKAIQVETIGSENWNMASEPYVWVPKF
ncbi:MAG TPA: DUF4390 domain-containing protein [Methylophilaceae bacterium]|nr:DUF4390 domain-containing protein [Methylophilaceae bacterium]